MSGKIVAVNISDEKVLAELEQETHDAKKTLHMLQGKNSFSENQ